MLENKLKNLIPAMEKFIQISNVDGFERGFTFRTNDKSRMEDICEMGTECQLRIRDIKKIENTKTGIFHTHPSHTSMRQTTGIAKAFSCSDILVQTHNEIDYGCVGSEQEIVCATLKSKIPEDDNYVLFECASLHHFLLKKDIYKYLSYHEQNKLFERLEQLEKGLDIRLRNSIDFEIIKKTKNLK